MVTVSTIRRGTELGLQAYWAILSNGTACGPFLSLVMKLEHLLAALPQAQLLGDGGVAVTSLCYDSRQAGPGALFVAVPGLKADGHDYIGQALEGGAVAVAVQADRREKWRGLVSKRGVPALVAPDTRAALAQIAAVWHGHPARRLGVIGVTGTDGKTSLAHLIAHLLEAAGLRTGLVSTAECRSGWALLPDTGRLTTPEAPYLQAMLSQMVEAGCRWAVIEATSHGLALHRLDGCEFDIAVVTNVGADHMDFHGTAVEYLAAKGQLFALLDGSVVKGVEKAAVLNADDPSQGYFRGLTRARTITYGLQSQAEVSAAEVVPEGWGSRFLLKTPTGAAWARIGRPGPFNVGNALAAAAVGLAAGLELDATVQGLISWPGAPGRMEPVDEGQPFAVVVDFAHAPDSLRRALALLRARCRGRLIAVFGCIGERDRERRFPMGRVAAELADYTIVTDDNPYTEDRWQIIGEIAAGLRAAGKREGHDFALIPDRCQAIAQALAMAVDEDVVLLAGKGHEQEVHLPGSSYRCDDREVARQLLRKLLAGR